MFESLAFEPGERDKSSPMGDGQRSKRKLDKGTMANRYLQRNRKQRGRMRREHVAIYGQVLTVQQLGTDARHSTPRDGVAGEELHRRLVLCMRARSYTGRSLPSP